MRQAGRQAGFTLLELLVGLVVLGFILAGLTQGVRYGLRATDAQAGLVDSRGELDAVDRTLRRLLTQADPGSARGGSTLQGGAGRVAFVSTLPGAATGFVTQRADMALGLSGDRLLLRWSPHLHARRFGPPPAAGEAELLGGVQGIELAYWKEGWRSTWDENGMPTLVRLRIAFPPGDKRHWPDIVAAPLRGRIQ
jgi:general secretion pathway protein J